MPVSNFSELKVIIDLEGEFLTRGNQKRASFSIIIKFFLDFMKNVDIVFLPL